MTATGARRSAARVACSAILLVAVASVASAQTPEATGPPVPPEIEPQGTAPILLILDASGSMNADDGTGRPKIEAAREAMLALIEELPEATRVGLRLYGHRSNSQDREAGCRDTELVVPVGPLDRAALRAAVQGVQASGFTPIGASLQASLGDLGGEGVEGPRTVVLVSDGIDTCAPPDPCDVARQLVAVDVELRVETIGFQVDPAAAAQLRCIAEVTGGQFRPVETAEELLRALRVYEPSGEPISGAPGPEDAPVLGSGQYLDSITIDQERWYAVELERGQLLRSVATIVGPDDGPVSTTAEFQLEILAGDILGLTRCARDEVRRIGQEARQVAADGLDAVDEGLCRAPGRYYIRLSLSDDDSSSPLEDVTLTVELLVSIVNVGAPPPASEEPDTLPTGQAAPAAPVRRPPTPAREYLVVAIGAGLVGLIGGGIAGRRAGP